MTNDYPRCATCRHWDEDEHPWGCCSMPINMLFSEYPEMNSTEAESKVSIGVGGWDPGEPSIQTHADFGCVLHEERTE